MVLLVEASNGYPHHNHIHRHVRRHKDDACHSPMLTNAMRLLQTDTNNIKQNLRCRMDPGVCSESMLRTNDVEQTYFAFGDVCNGRFLCNFRTILREFYMNMTRIRGHITALQADLILFKNDPLLLLTNKLTNDVRNALQASQPNVAISLPLSCTYKNDLSGESGMLMDLIQTINNFGNFVTTAFQILET